MSSESDEAQLTWEVGDREFPHLEVLLMENLNLVHWELEDNPFPRLRHLVFQECSALKETPSSIGEILTLKVVEVDESSSGVVASVEKMQEEQRCYGNYDLQVRIYRSSTA